MKTVQLIGAAAVLMLVSGCGNKATGQVVAVVNGEEISQQELNAELQTTAVSQTDKEAATTAALQRLVDRKLLVQTAKKDGLDRTPEYLTQTRRGEDELLINLLATKASKTVGVPDAAAVGNYMNNHPNVFGGRARYQIDQLSFPVPKDTTILKRLEPLHDLESIARMLGEAGIATKRNNGVIDTANIPTAVVRQIAALKPGEPFVLVGGANYTANVIRGVQAVQNNPAEAQAAAAAFVRQEKTGGILKSQVDAARSAAKITYQDGFAPASKPAAAK